MAELEAQKQIALEEKSQVSRSRSRSPRPAPSSGTTCYDTPEQALEAASQELLTAVGVLLQESAKTTDAKLSALEEEKATLAAQKAVVEAQLGDRTAWPELLQERHTRYARGTRHTRHARCTLHTRDVIRAAAGATCVQRLEACVTSLLLLACTLPSHDPVTRP